MPAEESGSGTNMWQSFNYGSAHFISIDTETDYDHAPEGVDTIFKAGASALTPNASVFTCHTDPLIAHRARACRRLRQPTGVAGGGLEGSGGEPCRASVDHRGRSPVSPGAAAL